MNNSEPFPRNNDSIAAGILNHCYITKARLDRKLQAKYALRLFQHNRSIADIGTGQVCHPNKRPGCQTGPPVLRLVLVGVISSPAWVPFPVPPRVKFDELGAGRGVAFVADEVRALFADLDAALSITLETHGFSPWLGKSI